MVKSRSWFVKDLVSFISAGEGNVKRDQQKVESRRITRIRKENSLLKGFVLVQWESTKPELATWEDALLLQQSYPSLTLEDKGVLKGKGPKFPEWLKNQSSVKVLAMSKAGISDLVPSWFWNWSLQLEFLDLSNNLLRGDVSNIFLNSSIIDLSSNLFKGTLPSVSANVEVLNVANNSISGTVSPLLCGKTNATNKLSVLDVSNNVLSGDLGQCWVHWQALVHLNLGSNSFSGEIPNSIGYLSELESLLLNDNGLSEYIPSTLQNCSTMKFIDMGNNQLSDTIPTWMWEMQYLIVLRLRSNNFSGSITQKMCQLSSLIVLDLANNSLSGSIPNCLDQMKTMAGEDDFFDNPLSYSYGSDFSYNNYMESLELVPKGDELEYRDNLILVRMIDLSCNKLSGAIPPEISNLSALRIPTSTQLQSFETLSYTGNPELCGPPKTNNCTSKEGISENASVKHADGNFFGTSEFYIGIGVGFAAGFWGVCSVIFFNRTWRHAYFDFIEHLKDVIYVTVVLKDSSVHLASGNLTISSLGKRDKVVVVLACVRDEVENGFKILNYGLTVAAKRQEKVLKELDRVLAKYSFLSKEKVKGVSGWEAPLTPTSSAASPNGGYAQPHLPDATPLNHVRIGGVHLPAGSVVCSHHISKCGLVPAVTHWWSCPHFTRSLVSSLSIAYLALHCFLVLSSWSLGDHFRRVSLHFRLARSGVE
ncbi:hypothetical protein V8G54_012814 [Vigna mungo]|uniref:Uncharacterized protein n=1 Tax=Vigna mungo TaxID=3915 RepID=A0AAQ3NVJ9_VIGMU